MPNTKLDKGFPSIPEYTKPNGQSIRYGSSLMMNCIGLGVMLNMFLLLVAMFLLIIFSFLQFFQWSLQIPFLLYFPEVTHHSSLYIPTVSAL